MNLKQLKVEAQLSADKARRVVYLVFPAGLGRALNLPVISYRVHDRDTVVASFRPARGVKVYRDLSPEVKAARRQNMLKARLALKGTKRTVAARRFQGQFRNPRARQEV